MLVEHRATVAAIQALVRLQPLLPARPPQAHLALGGAVARDTSVVPALMAATTLESLGFETVNLGADTPADTFRLAVEHHHPILVWICATHVADPRATADRVQALASELCGRGLQVLVGGAGADSLGLRPLPGLLVSRSMCELEGYVRDRTTAPGSNRWPVEGQ